MTRKEFLQTCASACVGLAGMSLLLESCAGIHYVEASVVDRQLQLGKDEFVRVKGDRTEFRRYVVARFQGSDYPVVIYRFSETEYSALLLRCMHQYNELSVNGDLLTCPAHGSEYDNRGNVVQGPAERPLKSFTVTTDESNVYVNLV
jgi:Rieske Fe-S protein